MLEPVVTRVLGALRFTDVVTAAWLEDGVAIEGDEVSTVRNRSGLYVVTMAARLGRHTTELLAPPAAPQLGRAPAVLTIRPRAREFLPRQITMRLPRDPDPAGQGGADSLFRPVEVPLFRSPAAQPQAGWAAVRVSARRRSNQAPLANVYLRVVRSRDDELLGRGLTDARGEGVVFVAGLPLVNWNDGPGTVSTSEVEVRLEGYLDRSAPAIADPDRFEGRLVELARATTTLRLATGRERSALLELPPP